MSNPGGGGGGGAPTLAQIQTAASGVQGGYAPLSSGLVVPTAYLPSVTAQGGATAAALTTETARAQAAEALLAPLASPALTGTPTAPTRGALDNSTRLGTTAYTDAAVGVETARAQTAEALLAPLASPVLTGSPTAPTQATADNSTKLATTAYVKAQPAASNRICVQTADQQPSASGELIVAQGTLTAGLLVVGNTMHFVFGGEFFSTGTQAIRVRIGTAGTTADAAVFTASVTGLAVSFACHGWITVRTIGSGGTLIASGGAILSGGTAPVIVYGTGTTAINTTVANFFSMSLSGSNTFPFDSETAMAFLT